MRITTTARAVLLLAALTAGSGGVLAAPASAANAAKAGIYTDNRPGKATSIEVARGATRIRGMSISCPKPSYATGVVQLRGVPISADGTFAVQGRVNVLYPGAGRRTAQVRISGTFQRGKVVGSLAPVNGSRLCNRMAFSARYFGAISG